MSQSSAARTVPWLAFGFALVIAVAAVMFSLVIWLVGAQERGELADRLESAGQRIHLLSTDLERLGVTERELSASRQETADVESRLTAASARLSNLERERDRLALDIEQRRNPLRLPTAGPADLFDLTKVRLNVTVTAESDHGLSIGSVRETIRQAVVTGHRLEVVDDQISPALVVRVTSADAGAGVVAIAVSLEVHEVWTLPGANRRHEVATWSTQLLGVCMLNETPAFTEELLGRVLGELGGMIRVARSDE